MELERTPYLTQDLLYVAQLTLSHLICWAGLGGSSVPILLRKSCLPWWRLKRRSQYSVWGFLQKVILCTSLIQHICFLTCTQNMRHNHRPRKTVLNRTEYLPKWNLIALKNKTKKMLLRFSFISFSLGTEPLPSHSPKVHQLVHGAKG